MRMPSYSKNIIKSLVEGNLPWQTAKQIISGEKDEDRFEKYLEILQEKVPWPDTIVVPLDGQTSILSENRAPMHRT